MICCAEPGMTEEFYIVQKEDYEREKSLVVTLKGLGIKANRMAANSQLWLSL
jgi:hypothetical protein